MSSGALFPLADVAPYRLIGGHLTANLPSSSQQNIVVAQVSDDGRIEHAVILDLNQVTGSNLDQNSLYETSLGSDISGTNPFTGNQDEVDHTYIVCPIWMNQEEVNDFMGCGCYGTGFQRARSYLTEEERIAILKEYKDELEKEGQGVVERIKELEAS